MDRQKSVCFVCFMCDFVCDYLRYTLYTVSSQLYMCHINLFTWERLSYCWLTTHILVLFIYDISKVLLYKETSIQ